MNRIGPVEAGFDPGAHTLLTFRRKDSGQYPAAEQDVGSALAYLSDHAGQYGIEPDRMMLLGHSAGALLVALTSTDPSFVLRAGLPLDHVACTAPLDTTYDIAAQIAGGGTAEPMFRNAFGHDPAAWDRASPLRNVASNKGIPSFHIVTRGTPGRVAQSQDFGATLGSRSIAADVQVVTGLSHEEVNAAVGMAGDTRVTPQLMAFFRRCAHAS